MNKLIFSFSSIFICLLSRFSGLFRLVLNLTGFKNLSGFGRIILWDYRRKTLFASLKEPFRSNLNRYYSITMPYIIKGRMMFDRTQKFLLLST